MHIPSYQHVFIVALERRLSSDGISDDTGEDGSIRPLDEVQSLRLPDEIDTFANSGQRSFSDLLPQDARYCFESDSSNSDLANNFEVDIALSQLSSSLVLPVTELSPVNFICDLMRSELYVQRAFLVRAKLSLTGLQFQKPPLFR
jgi:hypothetical protein